MGFGGSAKPEPAPVSAPSPTPKPVVEAPMVPPPTPENPLILSSPQAPAASTQPIQIETTSLAPPPQAIHIPIKAKLEERPKKTEKPKEEGNKKFEKPKEEKESKKAEEPTFSIETTKLEVDEKELGIRNAQIPKKVQTEEKKPAGLQEIKEQMIKSKQNAD